MMAPQFVTMMLGAASGLVGGTLAGWFVRSHDVDVAPSSLPDQVVGVESDDANAWIDEEAKKWADDNGMPEASRIIARRIRFGLALQNRKWGRS